MWEATNASAAAIQAKLPESMLPAYFELVYHPVQASYTLASMWIAAGYNNLRASQARLSTNDYADQVETLFAQDFALEQQYHALLDGAQCFRSFLVS